MRASRPLAAALVALAGSLACGLMACRQGKDVAKQSLHLAAYPMAAFRAETPDRVIAVAPPTPRWIEMDDGRHAALVARADSDLAVRVDDLGATAIHVSPILLPAEDTAVTSSSPPCEVTFRIRGRTSRSDAGRVLFETTLTDGAATETPALPISVDLVAAELPVRFLGLEVDYARDGVLCAQAAWLDPLVFYERRAPLAAAVKRPMNVVVLTSDTTRRDYLGFAGGAAQTPHLDRLARTGTVFENAYSVAFGTTPSHSSLFSGSPPAVHGVYDNSTVLDDSFATLAEILGRHGWSTAAFVSAMPLARSLGLSQGFDLYDDLFLLDGDSSLGRYVQHERRADLTVSRFLAWLAAEPREPFFAWLHFFDAHQPYAPPTAEPMAVEVHSFFEPADGSPGYLHASQLLAEAPAVLSAIDQEARSRYRREIEFLDTQLGRLFGTFEARNLDARSLFVFLADHGENFLDERTPHLAFGHASLLPSVSHIPLVIRTPGPPFDGGSATILVGNLDVAPTVLDYLGLDRPEGWTGRSFLRGVRDEATAFRPELVLEGAHQQEIAIRKGRWLYRELLPDVRGSSALHRVLGFSTMASAEIFDLEADPFARSPLDPQSVPQAAELEAILDRYLTARRPPRSTTSLDHEQHTEALRALGYLQ